MEVEMALVQLKPVPALFDWRFACLERQLVADSSFLGHPRMSDKSQDSLSPVSFVASPSNVEKCYTKRPISGKPP